MHFGNQFTMDLQGTGSCFCQTGFEGDHCEVAIASNTSDVPLGAILGAIIPAVVIALVVMCCIIEDDWEVDMNELEMGEQLGAGGFGEVHKAVWKGTEVAVKMMISENAGRELERNFKEEVRVMTALRHPNVVLFMAACTKPPKMCIVMEYMALGSLFDLLHNELIPDIPFALRNKMAYQAAKGMHFLHSSGIVHRDLKSLNLLLDSKWNVSDFGLTKFKEEMNRNTAKEIQGSVHWTAPEILNEAIDIDFMVADVYSFGIILWELMTRQQPYMGMRAGLTGGGGGAMTVYQSGGGCGGVLRDNARPPMPELEQATVPAEFVDLIGNCWHHDPTIRPSFLEVMTRLSALGGEGGTSSLTRTSTSSSSGGGGGVDRFGSWTMPSGGSASNTSTGSSSSDGRGSAASAGGGGAAGGVRAPEGEMAIVFSDITRAASLWEFNAEAMRDATLLHNDTMRSFPAYP
ncbi:serine/threonine protein kinase, putative [Acanthamoeba castellanii str. Neff]|uniref:non-specific serine/threonine protein kinase n=1 Tax=Acanthamoeba castellanii (strain ATCC 30010 / Neff) TaxID=1257118 RepID=L8GJN7_ACACF|nr:serine/threonine protein kinase, putative [Acanthamoeba castellanii str. Neff]ELR13232.1 serine/threonine protein kinase, putative [Acanthamoeba castellanii str. Neff]